MHYFILHTTTLTGNKMATSRNVLAAVTALFLLVSTSASAGLIVLTDSEAQTADFQNFTFNFGGLDLAIGGAVFDLEIRGDFHSPASNEGATFNLEGILSGLLDETNEGTTSSDPSGMRTLTQSYVLTQAQTNSILADGSLTIDIDFLSGVHDFSQSYPNPGVTVAFSYESASVPEPSTLAIFALGMIGLASRRFKK